jgi:hypothetical protein
LAPPPKRCKVDVIEIESSDKDEMGDMSTVTYMDVEDSDPEVVCSPGITRDSDPEVLCSPGINDDKDVTDDLQVSDSSEEDEIFVDSPSYYDEDGDLRF